MSTTKNCRGIAGNGPAGVAPSCLNRTRHPSGLCHHHRDQMGSGDHDDRFGHPERPCDRDTGCNQGEGHGGECIDTYPKPDPRDGVRR